jgi:hypothetical protein
MSATKMDPSKIKPGKKYAYQLKARAGTMKLEAVRTAANNSTWYDGIDLETKVKVSARLGQLAPAPVA